MMCSGCRVSLSLRCHCSHSSSAATMSRELICAALDILFLAPATGVLHLLMTELIAFLTAPGLTIFGSNFKLRFTATPSGTLPGHRNFLATGGLRYLLQFLRAVQRAIMPSSSESEYSEEEGWELGTGVLFFPLRGGLGSGFAVFSFGWAMWVSGWAHLFLFRVFFLGAVGFCFFLFFFLSLVRVGLGVLDHGAGLMVCFSFPFLIHYISQLDIPDFVHFVFNGPLHFHKVGKRSRLHDCMQVHGL